MPAYQGVYRRGAVWAFRAQTRTGSQRNGVSGSGFATAKDAAAARARALKDMEVTSGAADPTMHRLPLGDFCDVWLASRNVKPTTLGEYRTKVAYFKRQPIAAVPLRKLTAADVTALVRTMQETLAHDTAVARLGVLRSVLNYAVTTSVLAKSPAAGVRVSRTRPRPRRQFWDAATARRFLEHCAATEDPLLPLYRLALATGMRRGELLGLRWDDIDLGRGLVHVRWNRTVAEGRVVEHSPKTSGSEAPVPVDPATLAALGAPGRGHVFKHPVTGEPWSPHTMVNRFLRSCLDAGVPAIKFHALRHTAATIMAEAGVPMVQAKERLRHWSASMTEAYTSVTSASARQVADLMGALLSGPEAGHPDPVRPLRLVS